MFWLLSPVSSTPLKFVSSLAHWTGGAIGAQPDAHGERHLPL